MLKSRATVEKLSNLASHRYHQNYLPGTPVPRDIDVRNNAILTAIGCLPVVF